jgi:hypothetical protein
MSYGTPLLRGYLFCFFCCLLMELIFSYLLFQIRLSLFNNPLLSLLYANDNSLSELKKKFRFDCSN